MLNFMRHKNRSSITLFFLSLISASFAQDPPGIKWKQIQTNHYQIIFPKELQSDANRVANTMEHVHQGLGKNLKHEHKKIPILLSNRSAIPNGYVGQAPWRSEWFNIPLMIKEMGSTEWYRDLAVHEGRHIVQTNYMNQGVSRFLGMVFGEGTQSLYTGFLIPSWYWEGDAVGIETALTHSGRGRSSYFNRTTRALILEGKKFNYEQALYGSYKEDYPGHYELGYFFTDHIKHTYGKEAWPNIINKTLRWPFILNPFFPLSRSMKKTTGLSLHELYGNTFNDLGKNWGSQLEKINESPANIISPKTKIKTSFLYPTMTPNGEIIVLKTGLGNVPTIVKIGRIDTVLKKISPSANLFGYHSNGARAVWSAYDPDKRWTKQSWANIRILDIDTGQLRTITSKKRIFNPNISQNNKLIAAVSFSETRQCSLMIMDSETGKIIDQVEAPNQGLIMYPSWSNDGREIVFTSQKYSGRAIYIYDREKRKFEILKAESWTEIFKPVFYQDYIIYESIIQGIDQLVAIHRDNKKEYQVTTRKFGATNPAVNSKGQLLFNDYTSKGDAVAVITLKPDDWAEIPSDRKQPILGSNMNSKDKAIYDLPIPKKEYEIRDYKPALHLFNFHSRYIFDDELSPSLGLQSDNILGTMKFNMDLIYSQNEKTLTQRIKSTYSGFYPIFDFELGYGKRDVRFGPFTQKVENTRDSIKFAVNEKWDELNVNFGMSIPLKNSRRGITTQYSYAKAGIKFTKRSDTHYHYSFDKIPPNVRVKEMEKRSDRDGGIMPVYIEGGMSSIDESAPRDLGNPGWQIYGYFGGAPLGGLWKGQQLSIRMQYGKRGLGKHHFIGAQLQYETNQGDYIIPSKVTFPYGYNWYFPESIWRLKIKYQMPLVYPDLSLPFSVAYLKRIHGGPFVDAASVSGHSNMLAVGGAITFETGGFFDIKFPISLSINYYYHPLNGNSGIRLDFE